MSAAGMLHNKHVVLTLVFCWPEIPRLHNSPLTQARPIGRAWVNWELAHLVADPSLL